MQAPVVDAFTEEELTLLMEAVESWKQETVQQSMVTGLLSVAQAQGKEEAKSNFLNEIEKGQVLAKLRTRQAILLQAKLIRMQDEITQGALFNGNGENSRDNPQRIPDPDVEKAKDQ